MKMGFEKDHNKTLTWYMGSTWHTGRETFLKKDEMVEWLGNSFIIQLKDRYDISQARLEPSEYRSGVFNLIVEFADEADEAEFILRHGDGINLIRYIPW